MKTPLINLSMVNSKTIPAVACPWRVVNLITLTVLQLTTPSNAQVATVPVYSLASAWTGAASTARPTINAATNPNDFSNIALTASGGSPFSIPSVAASDRLLVITISGEMAAAPTSVTWGGIAMTQATFLGQGSGFGSGFSSIYYLANPASGSGPLGLTGYTGNRFTAYAVYATGVKSTPEATATGGNASGTATIDTTTPPSITPTPGALVVTAYGGSPSGAGVEIVSPKIVRASDNSEPAQTTPPRAANANTVGASGHMIANEVSPFKARATVSITTGQRSISLVSFAPAGPAVFSSLSVVAAPTTAMVGEVFDVTITAKDASNSTVLDSTTIVGAVSPSSVMEFDWNSDGTYGDASGTLVDGVITIKARNKRAETTTIGAAGGGATAPSPASFTTTPDAFAMLQILAPGETAAPGTFLGKSGTPSLRVFNVSFNLIVNAVDQYWNLVNTVTDTVSITSLDPAATLPPNAPLLAGTGTFPMTLVTPAGAFTASAANVTDSSKIPDTTPILPLQTVFAWQGDGTANLWDTTAVNWLSGSTSYAFVNGVGTTFGEAATNRTIEIVSAVSPTAITVSNATGSYTFGSASDGSITGTTGLTKSGAGTLTLSTANTYTGVTNISGGILSANTISDSGASAIGFGPLTLSGGTLSYTGADSATTVRTVSQTINSTINVSDAVGSLTLSGSVNGGILTKTGLGTLILSGITDNANLILNATAGEVQLAKGTTANIRALAGISGIGNGATVKLIGPGTDQIFGGNLVNQGVNGIVAGGTLNLNGLSETVGFLNGTGGVVDGGSGTPTLTVGQSDTSSTFGGVIQNTAGSLNLTKTGTGTLTLTGANTFSGTTTVGNGTINLNHSLAIQNSALATVGGAATKLVLGAGITTPTFGGLSGASVNLSPTMITNYGSVTSLTLNPTTGTVTYGGAITNGASAMTLIKTGAGTQVLSGNNTYTGPTTVNAGSLALVGGSQSSPITVATGASLGFTLGSATTSTAAVKLTAGRVAITGTVNNTGDYQLMTAASFTGPFRLATPVSGYQLQSRASGSQLWLVRVSDPFIAWAGSGINFDDDSNSDGVDNGLAWLLGAATADDNALGRLPVITQDAGNLKVTFKVLPESARGTSQLFLEHSPDLTTWSTGELVTDAGGGTAPVTFVVTDSDPGDPNNLLDVEATVSSSAAVDSKLFCRLKAAQ